MITPEQAQRIATFLQDNPEITLMASHGFRITRGALSGKVWLCVGRVTTQYANIAAFLAAHAPAA